jgi:LDH2 family malate/lactate/ureidoglycolate dehydrogenase
MTSGERAAMEASVYVIEMNGNFTLADAHMRPGESAPQGSVLRLVVDARTGVLEGRSLSTTVQAPLENLGKVKELG